MMVFGRRSQHAAVYVHGAISEVIASSSRHYYGEFNQEAAAYETS